MVSDGGTVYLLHTKFGKSQIPKRDVEKAGRSTEEIYQYRVGRLPDRDPDEHMKLALWCLTERMTAQAKTQLQAVLALSPKNPRALGMLDKIEKSEDRAAIRDPGVMQTKSEAAEGRPEALDRAVLGGARRELGISTLPQIPGLPAALAVKRAGEFSRYVDPVVQLRCARCHNEQFAGSFRLVQYKNRHDQTPDARRANLDAVLGLVDRENPAKSEFLSSTLRLHGTGSGARPIFRGSNDPEYQILSAWVNSLRSARPAQDAQAARFSAPEASPAGGEGFATQRGQVPLPLTPTPPVPPGHTFPGMVAGSQPYAPPDPDFPAPYLLGGPKPKPATDPAAASVSPAVPAAGGVNPPLPGPPQAGQAVASGAPDAAAAKAKRKPVKVDPALLERALMNRYTPH
jgi:hypothetical protein